MNIRFLALVATVTLLSMTSGCCGLKDFMFGRGARCGLCQRLGAPASLPAYAPQAPCSAAPYAPAATYAPAAPTCSQPMVYAPNADCGCNGYARGGDVSYGSAYSPGCECHNPTASYGGIVNDPYLSSGGVPYGETVVGEQIIGEQVIGGTTYPGMSYPSGSAPLPSGDWQARKFDSDGNKILWEEPLPHGAITQ
jgi:hypothetical protein